MEDAQGRPADHVTLNIEHVLDRSMRHQTSLSGFAGFESEHVSLAPSDEEMGIPDAVVLAQAPAPTVIDEDCMGRSDHLERFT
jgi:hypothetical protein